MMISMAHSNSQAQDELAALLSRNLTFNPEIQAQEAFSPSENVASAAAITTAQPVSYSVSQHYHHSAHIPRPEDEPLRPSSEPSQGQSMSAEHVLRIHGVDPFTLTPSQLQLFRIADQAQRRRLVELWSICPPGNGGDIPSLAWSSTTVEQEEHLARMRYERLHQVSEALSLDGTAVQSNDGSWHQQATAQESEPYMMSGYEELMRREQERERRSMESQRSEPGYGNYNTSSDGSNYSPATDPVYQGPDYARQQQLMNMASQYGAFQENRGVAETMDVMM